ncbi:MAG: ankyrin repeat domain-containing protein [Bdellovibrionaceae bacterium]|nr:ankyrin repeat domain-containing protein [Pseudobdellovibrionaceae bacterium]
MLNFINYLFKNKLIPFFFISFLCLNSSLSSAQKTCEETFSKTQSLNDKSNINLIVFKKYLSTFINMYSIHEMNDQNLPFLHVAVENGDNDLVKALIHNGENFNINALDKYGNTALHIAVWNGYINIVQILLKNKADVNIKGTLGTILHIAVQKKYYNIVKILLNHKATDVNLKDINDSTALIIAVIMGHNEIVQMLLNHKSTDVNLKDSLGSTALIIAVVMRRNQIVQMLLNHKSTDVNLKHRKGYTPLDLSLNRDHEINELLQNNGAINSNWFRKIIQKLIMR